MHYTFKPKLGWQDCQGWSRSLIGLYCLTALSPVAVAWLFAELPDRPLLVNIALLMAMTGFSLLCLQVVLAGRLKALDRPFGYDRVIGFHKKMALAAVILLVLHPILIAVGHGHYGLFGLQASWPVNLGRAALLFLILGVLFAMTFHKLNVDYNLWRFGHKAMVFVVILGFSHGLVIGPHINQSAVVRTFWIALFGVAAGIFGFRNFVLPFIRRKFIVTDIARQTHDTYTLTFEPTDNKPLHRNPGQFMFLKLIRPGRPSELHPFTISASPLKQNLIQATIKQSGNFTDTIDRTVAGDIGRIEAPFGRFSYVYDNPDKIVFIAGGVGITPIMSMLRTLRQTDDPRPVVLIYGNKSERDIIFREELETLPDNVKIIHVLNSPEANWQGERGYVTKEIIKKYADDVLKDAHVYLCGPPVMMSKVITVLHEMSTDDKRIHYERFTL